MTAMNPIERSMNKVYSTALRYAQHGWLVGFTKLGSKAPDGVRGVKHLTTDKATLDAWFDEYGGKCNIMGSPPQGTCVIDVDLYKLPPPQRDLAKAKVLEFVKRHNCVATVSARGGIHLLVENHDGLSGESVQALFGSPGDIRRHERGYVLLAGSVFEDKVYKELKGHEMDARVAPRLPLSVAKPKLVESTVAQKAVHEPMEDAPSSAEIKAMLKHMDPDGPYEYWLGVGMALHNVYGASLGLKIWDWWSRQSAFGKYETEGPYSCAEKWKSFKPEGKDRLLSLGTLKRYASAGGWERTTALEDFGGDGWFARNMVGPLLEVDPPPYDWVLYNVVERGSVVILAGPGGTGKSMFLYRVGAMGALGLPFVLGMESDLWSVKRGGSHGRVLMISAEEERHHVARRMHAQANALNLTPEERAQLGVNLAIIPVAGAACSLVSEAGQLSKFAQRLIDEIKLAGNVDLLVLDPSVFFGGDSEIDTNSVVDYMRALRNVAAKANVAIIVCMHTRKGAQKEDGVLSADSIRGNAMFVNLARGGAWTLFPMDAATAKLHGLGPGEEKKYVGVAHAKANDAALSDLYWLERGPRGTLAPPTIPLIKVTEEVRKQAKAKEKVVVEDVKRAVRVTNRKAQLLTNVRDHPSISSRERGAALGIDRSNITAMLGVLETEKLIRCVKRGDAAKRESSTYELTAAGRTMMSAA